MNIGNDCTAAIPRLTRNTLPVKAAGIGCKQAWDDAGGGREA